MLANGTADGGIAQVLQYHDRTKHHFERLAPALGYLDWATQPDPFRRYADALSVMLPHDALPDGGLFDDLGCPRQARTVSLHSIGELLRCSLGISAWKQHGSARWALRVNPSSGNLHPTEGYLVAPGIQGDDWSVCHYTPREHGLEVRARLTLAGVPPAPPGTFLVGLTSIHWREAWKYGERAFRYCQHDVGHAIAALRYASALLGWRLWVLPHWADGDIAALLGVERPRPAETEPEHPDCLLAVGPGDVGGWAGCQPEAWVRSARASAWSGVPNQLSPAHVVWPAIDDVTDASTRVVRAHVAAPGPALLPPESASDLNAVERPTRRGVGARQLLLQRRSAVSFDGGGMLSKDAFVTMVTRVAPVVGTSSRAVNAQVMPWDSWPWTPQVHLVWFVHRVEGVAPGIYLQLRDPSALAGLRAGFREDVLWEPALGLDAFFLLVPLDCRSLARRLSCDQDIASDGYVGMAMLARMEPALREFGPWFYRHLFWECGMVGQVLYLEAEAAGGRATGIGCFYDDAVHNVLGIRDHEWQSLYHFSIGTPVEDARLTTVPGYSWE